MWQIVMFLYDKFVYRGRASNLDMWTISFKQPSSPRRQTVNPKFNCFSRQSGGSIPGSGNFSEKLAS